MPGGRAAGIGVVLVLLAAGAAFVLWPQPAPEPAQPVARPTPPAPVVVADAGVADARVEVAAADDGADDNAKRGSAYLIASLKESKAFRARVQAAIILGRKRSARVTGALIGALRDRHPAVRIAAVESLRKIGTPRALAALRKREASESDPKVKRAVSAALATAPSPRSKSPPAAVAGTPAKEPEPSPPVVRAGPQYYVGVSPLADPKGALPAGQAGKFGGVLRRKVGGLSGVRLAPNGESSSSAQRVLASGATGYYLTASVTKLEFVPGTGMRAGVSLMVGTYPGRNMRAIVNGSVTLPGASDTPKTRETAIDAAIASAVRKLPPTFERSKR